MLNMGERERYQKSASAIKAQLLICSVKVLGFWSFIWSTAISCDLGKVTSLLHAFAFPSWELLLISNCYLKSTYHCCILPSFVIKCGECKFHLRLCVLKSSTYFNRSITFIFKETLQFFPANHTRTNCSSLMSLWCGIYFPPFSF